MQHAGSSIPVWVRNPAAAMPAGMATTDAVEGGLQLSHASLAAGPPGGALRRRQQLPRQRHHMTRRSRLPGHRLQGQRRHPGAAPGWVSMGMQPRGLVAIEATTSQPPAMPTHAATYSGPHRTTCAVVAATCAAAQKNSCQRQRTTLAQCYDSSKAFLTNVAYSADCRLRKTMFCPYLHFYPA